MKRMLLLFFALLILSSTANALSPDSTYVALYVDSLRTTSRVDYVSPPPVMQFAMWIYWLPSARGFQVIEFKMSYPSSIIQGSITPNDSISVELGSLGNGITSAWLYCERGWIWSHHQDLYLKNNTQGQIMVIANPSSGKFQVGTCELGIPLEPVRRMNNICLNYDCGTGVQSTTWGAIKEMYR